MQYPIEITEHPHRGAPRTWTLWDNTHLMRCIEATSGKYEEWVESEGGAAVFHVDEDGNVHILTQEDAIYCPENFIDFLRRDLKKIETREMD
jgi:hypothetical protein